ncbi:MAG: ribonuclease E inhibitor RraB [Acinetobacter sp.]
MSNSKVLENLKNHGDSLEVARPVDHWVYFKSLNEQSNFIKKVEDLGFTVVEKTTAIENKNYPYKLVISRKDHVDQLSIDQCTLVLFELAKQANAQYDGWETQVIRN